MGGVSESRVCDFSLQKRTLAISDDSSSASDLIDSNTPMMRLAGQQASKSFASCQRCQNATSMPATGFSRRLLSMHAPHMPRSRSRVPALSSNIKANTQQRRSFWWSSSSTASGLNPFAGSGAGQTWESLDFVPQVCS